MGIPFEALLPYAIIVGMFGVAGGGLTTVKYLQNGGQRPRRSLDAWDKQMMERDLRLTGYLRGQRDNPIAPPGFDVNSAWKVETTQF